MSESLANKIRKELVERGVARGKSKEWPAEVHRTLEAKKELETILQDYAAAILQAISNKLSDKTVTRVWVSELPYLREFSQSHRSFMVLDVLREWANEQFKGLMRVEGDKDYAGFALIIQ